MRRRFSVFGVLQIQIGIMDLVKNLEKYILFTMEHLAVKLLAGL